MTAKEFREEFKDFEEGLRHELEFMREDKELCGERFVGEKVNCHFFTHNATSEEDFFELEMLKVFIESFEKL